MTEFSQFFSHAPIQDERESSLYVLDASHRKCKSEYQIGPRTFDFYRILLVVKGKGKLIQKDKEYTIYEGDVFILFPEMEQSYCADHLDPWEIISVSFQGNSCDAILNYIGFAPEKPILHPQSTERLIHLLTHILSDLETSTDAYALRAVGFLYVFFSDLVYLTKQNRVSGKINTKNDPMKRALVFIELNYQEPLDVDTICRQVNYSRSYLSRLFKKEVGLTILEYINAVRIRKAKSLLIDTNLSIKEIAKQTGFKNQFYFSKMFKKVQGQAPSVYRATDLLEKNNFR
ncbi:AraC family transcriptional regulator [Fusibacter ferrireducens]|uniref:AraC family transcriptional regulator n=1 Tax=Fusibacter ferrireducens TaxID=2785058 RepID=A0ABR9ZWC7_9FIRM|nr:AraC family transcriptional regulator [Fusibacter ferrireducens]MBF4693934.1 AraC family transcriptional regulator [Fusibacter ferrireducens]